MSLSKKTKQLIRALQQKKHRREEQAFVVEGTKSVQELLTSDFEIISIAATSEFGNQNEKLLAKRNITFENASEKDITESGSLQSNNGAIAIARMKPNVAPVLDENEYVLALDDIRDPGNAGTIIRTADWYGIKNIIASEETADFYNAKTISATMGSFARVHVYYTNLKAYFSTHASAKSRGVKKPRSIYGAFLDGKDIHQTIFTRGAIIVIGNESNGISHEVASVIDQKITIPRFGGAESLNAALSTAIILDNLRRSQE